MEQEVCNILKPLNRDIKKDRQLYIKLGNKNFIISTVDYIRIVYWTIQRTFENKNVSPFMSLIYKKVFNTIPSNMDSIIRLSIVSKDVNAPINITRKNNTFKSDDKNSLIKLYTDLQNDILNNDFFIVNISIELKLYDMSHREVLLFWKENDKIFLEWYDPNGVSLESNNANKTIFINFIRPLLSFFNSNGHGGYSRNYEMTCYGLQAYGGLPYCVMHSYLWIYTFLNLIKSGYTNISSWVSNLDNMMLSCLKDKESINNTITYFAGSFMDHYMEYLTTWRIDDNFQNFMNGILNGSNMPLPSIYEDDFHVFYYNLGLLLYREKIPYTTNIIKPSKKNIIIASKSIGEKCIDSEECISGSCINGYCREDECKADSDCEHPNCNNDKSECSGAICNDGSCVCLDDDDCEDGYRCDEDREICIKKE